MLASHTFDPHIAEYFLTAAMEDSHLAGEAARPNRGVQDLVLEKKLLSRKDLGRILAPENLLRPRPARQKKDRKQGL